MSLLSRMSRSLERCGHTADLILRLEEKMLKESVLGFKALRLLKLVCFRDGVLAKDLENSVHGWKR